MANMFTKFISKAVQTVKTAFTPPKPTIKAPVMTKQERKDFLKKQKQVNKLNLREDKEIAKIRKKDTSRTGKYADAEIGGRSTLKQRRTLTKSPDTFDKRESFEKYMDRMDQMLSPSYRLQRMEQLQTNFIAGLFNTFGDDAAPLIEMIQKMDTNDFTRMYKSYDVLNFLYWSNTNDKGRVPYSDDEVDDFLSDLAEAVAQHNDTDNPYNYR